jgi:hypothetical protein
MSHLAKLNLKTITRRVEKDPVLERRNKLIAAIEEQRKALAAEIKGETYGVLKRRRETGPEGQKIIVEVEAKVRPWSFAQDGGWYVQCRYGARPLVIADKGNAVFVERVGAIDSVLNAFAEAAKAGEFDKALQEASRRMKAAA